MAFKFLGQRQLGKLPSRWVSTILMVAINGKCTLQEGHQPVPYLTRPTAEGGSWAVAPLKGELSPAGD